MTQDRGRPNAFDAEDATVAEMARLHTRARTVLNINLMVHDKLATISQLFKYSHEE